MADDREPLKAEAHARDEWRGEDAALKESDAPGHSLPESEAAEAAERDEEPRSPLATIRPPD